MDLELFTPLLKQVYMILSSSIIFGLISGAYIVKNEVK
jgi:hypothetical protein